MVIQNGARSTIQFNNDRILITTSNYRYYLNNDTIHISYSLKLVVS